MMTACESAAGAAAAVARVHALLPPAGPLRRYTVVSLVDATGTGLFLAVSVLCLIALIVMIRLIRKTPDLAPPTESATAGNRRLE